MSKREVNKKEYLKVYDCEHFLYHRGCNANNPVIIFLHGGPGKSELIFAHAFQENWEEKYTIIHYDQRGTGKTYTRNQHLPKPRLSDLIKDLNEIIRYVKKEYNKEKIILLGHSFGSILGSIYTKLYPEDVNAYIGTGQVINILENEAVGFNKLKEVVSSSGNTNDIDKIDTFDNFPYENFYENIYEVKRLQNKYNLSSRGLRDLKLALRSRMFGIRDLLSLMKSADINSELIEDVRLFDLNKDGNPYKVPIFYILGDNDWQTPSIIAKDYYEKINAPIKKFYMINNAGHFTMLDNTVEFNQALDDIYSQLID